MGLEYDREHHWRMFFKDDKRGVDDEKFIINDIRWDVYLNKEQCLINCGYYVEV